MRRFTTLTVLLALCCVSRGLSFEYDEEPRSSSVSRRAIDGTRGRKYFDPKEDGFFEDYGFDRGQYHGSQERTAFEDLRSNVPGEPGVDYAAYTEIPKTSFSCNNRARGYYADEEAGCQVFHVCDGGLVSSFLCPVGSLFSQRLLTCDWWSKVPCSQSQQFYEEQNFDSETLQQTLAERVTFQPQDQRQETDRTVPVFAEVRPNENQLTHVADKKQRTHVKARPSNKKDTDSPIIRVKLAEDDERRTRFRGHSSFRSSDVTSQGQRGHPSNGVSPTEPSVSAAPSVDQESRPTPRLETFSEVYQDNDALNAFPDAPLKEGLEESVNDTLGRPKFTDHNSAFEYDDMEGKESIGLAKSQAERNLERQDDNGKPVTASRETKTETMPLEHSEGSTDATVTDATTWKIEGVDAKEVHEKLNVFDGDKAPITEGVYNATERNAEESVTQIAPTVLLSNGTVNTLENNNVKVKTEKVKTHPQKSQVRKMSGFRINVIEKKRKSTTMMPIEDEVTSSDYHELFNSSDTSFTSTTSPVTVTSLDEFPTTLTNNVRRVSDAVEESNTPYGVTVSLNDDNYDRSLTRDEIIRQLISHQSQPVDSRNPGSHETKYDQTQATNPPEGVRNNQNYRTYHSQLSNSPLNGDRYQPPLAVTTFRNFPTLPDQFASTTTEAPSPTYDDYQSSDESSGLRNYQANQDESHSTNYQPHPSSTTTPAPVQNYHNYQSQYKPTDYTNYQVPQNDFYSTKYQFFNPTTPASLQNIDIPQEQNKPLDYLNYQSQHHESHNTRYQPFVPSTTTEVPQQNYNTYQNQNKQEDLINYQDRPHDSHTTEQQSYASVATTPIPQQNIDYYQNQGKLEDLKYQPRPVESHTTKQQSYAPTAATLIPQQNYDYYQNQGKQEDLVNYQPLPHESLTTKQQSYVSAATTPIPQQNYDYYQNQDKQEGLVNYQARPQESHSTKYQPYESTATTPVPQQNYDYYQNQDKQEDSGSYEVRPHEPRSTSYRPFIPSTTQVPVRNLVNYKNHQTEPDAPINHGGKEEIENFRHPKQFVSTTVRNLLTDDDIRDYQNQQLSRFNTYRNRPIASSTIKYSPSLLDNQKVNPIVSSTVKYSPSLLENPKANENHRSPQSLPQDFLDYPVNYQTHHYPEKFENYKLGKEQSNENSGSQSFENYQGINNQQNQQSQAVEDNVKDDRRQKNVNYSDYQNYDSAEDLLENTQFGSFGARLNSKNQNANSIKQADQTSNISSEADAHSINSGLQGKTSNFLFMMSQLLKNDRLPRPFAQNKNKVNPNLFTDFNNNNLNQIKPVTANAAIQQNNTSTVYHKINYNNNVQQNQTQNQYVIVDEFAAPRFIPHDSNIFLNQAINSNNALPSSDLNNRQNIDDQRHGKILNYKSSTSSNFQSSTQSSLNPYNIQSTPQVNVIPGNGNQQFVPIQSDYSEYNNVGNLPLPSEDLLPPKEIELQYNDYLSEQSTQSSIENTRVPLNNFNPLSLDFSYEQTTEQPTEEHVHFPNHQVFKNTQPPGDFGIDGQNSQESVESTPTSNENFQTSEQSSFDHSFYRTTPPSVKHTAVPNNTPISSNTQSQTIDYNFRPTVLPSSNNQDIDTADQRFNNYNVTRSVTTTKTTVETEFIPSISFDFGSVEGRKEYLEALEKGLVSSEESRNSNVDANTAASANVNQSDESSSSSEKSDIMSNFKDTTDVMSGTE